MDSELVESLFSRSGSLTLEPWSKETQFQGRQSNDAGKPKVEKAQKRQSKDNSTISISLTRHSTPSASRPSSKGTIGLTLRRQLKSVILDADLPFPPHARQRPLYTSSTHKKPEQLKFQSPYTAVSSTSASSFSVTTFEASVVLPDDAEPRVTEYRPVALKHSYGERLICERVPTSPDQHGFSSQFEKALFLDAESPIPSESPPRNHSFSGRSEKKKGQGRRSKSVELLSCTSASDQIMTWDWRDGERDSSWEGSYFKAACANGDVRKRGWIYAHASKVRSLHHRYWKKLFVVLDTDLTFYQDAIRNNSRSTEEMEGSGVEICIPKEGCLFIEATRFHPPRPFGILVEVATSTIRLAFASEVQRDDWKQALERYFNMGMTQNSLDESLPSPAICSPLQTATTFAATAPDCRDQSLRMRPLTMANGMPHTKGMPTPCLWPRRKITGALPIQVDDTITLTKKVVQRHRKAMSSSPMSRWWEEGLNARRDKWMDAVNTTLRVQGDREFTPTEALVQGIPVVRRTTLVDALSRNVHIDDSRNVQRRRATCTSMERELREVDSQVHSMSTSQALKVEEYGSLENEVGIEDRSVHDGSLDSARWSSSEGGQTTTVEQEEMEESLCRDIVTIFPKRWIEKASLEVGKLNWRSMSYTDQLSALYITLRDANEIGQILKDLPGADPTKATVKVTYQTIPVLLSNLVIFATRQGDRYKALSCLENIFDDQVRVECTNMVYQLAHQLWMDDLEADLIKRGLIKEQKQLKRTGTPSCPTKKQVLPSFAADALVTHAERMERLKLLDASTKQTPAEVIVNLTVDEKEIESSDDEPDVLGLTTAEQVGVDKKTECDGKENGEANETNAGEQRDANTAEGEKNDRSADESVDKECLKYVQTVKDLLVSHTTEEIIARIVDDHGHTLSPNFVEDLRSYMEIESILADMPENHPVRVNLMRYGNQLTKLLFDSWKAFAKQCTKHRKALCDQYLVACKHHRVLPVALQTLKRFVDDKSLQTLDLSNHSLTKYAACSIFEAITASGSWVPDGALDFNFVRQRLGDASLTTLDISDNDLRAPGVEVVVSNLTNVPCIWSLTTLKIDANALRDGGCKALVSLITSERISLKHLSVRKNKISDKAMAEFIEQLNDNRALLSLDMSENKAAGLSGKAIGIMLQENVTLSKLNCSSNMMFGRAAQDVAAGLKQNDVLQELDLSWNGFGDEGPCGELAEALERCCNLQTINIGYNRIQLGGAIALSSHLENNGAIRNIIMDGNPIGMTGIRLMMKAVKKAADDFPTEISFNNCTSGAILKNTFDPAEPAGDYELDMGDGFSAGILKSLLRLHAMGRGFFVALDQVRVINMNMLKVQAKPPANAWLDDQKYTISLPSYEGTDDDGKPCRIVNPDENDWKIPAAGKLRFKFAMILVRDHEAEALDAHAYEHLMEAFQDRKHHHKERVEAMELYIGDQTLVAFAQVEGLLELLRWNMSDNELCQSRGTFVAKCYHKLTESNRAPETLDLLDPEAREFAERILGVISLAFKRNNPTGHYKLRLSVKAEREICLRLIECRSEQAKRLSQLEAYYSARTGKRDPIERVWRNCKYDKRPFNFDMSWKVPDKGVIEFDFVSLQKPKEQDKPQSDDDFFRFCKRELDGFLKNEEEARFVDAVRRWSDSVVFTCKQLRRLLRRLRTSIARVELVVIGFARTVDWHSFKYIHHELSPREIADLRFRIGLVNLWDESMACDYYELDLNDPEARWVCQELVHLGVIEPGENMGECMYDGVDFTISAAWLKDVPRKGLLQVYYNREARIIRKIREKGAWDHDRSPFFKDGSVKDDGNVTFPDTSFQCENQHVFMPVWLQKYARDSDGALHEPPDSGWIREHKLRRIVSKLKQTFPSPKAAMKKLDRDGGGDLDRKEIARGLFEMGIWLHPDETKAMFEAIDEDDGGTVDQDEFISFWEDYGENTWADDNDGIDF